MREILGYAPIEPDGSVQIKVPAGVAFGVSVLDSAGRRTSPRHLNWLQLRAGEVLTCNGCHIPANAQPGGLPRYRTAGASSSRSSTAALRRRDSRSKLESRDHANQGETMAEARARVSCQTDCAALTPSVDVVYDDIWTDPIASGRAPDASFAYRYAQLTTPAPASAACQTTWSGLCRITIHYPNHINPIWSVPRIVTDAMGNVVADHTCVACHSPVDAAGAVRVPAAQLDLRAARRPTSPITSCRTGSCCSRTTRRKLTWARCRTSWGRCRWIRR
jgi:hypothetical protein